MVLESEILGVLNGLVDDFVGKNRFFRIWKKGSAHPEMCRKFLLTFDFLVKSFPTLIAAGAARMEDEETRTVLAVNLFQECGEGRKERTHHAIFRKFLMTAGLQVPSVPDPSFAVEWKTRLLRYLQEADSPQGALGALAAGEFLAQPVLGRIFPLLRDFYLTADAEYFTNHLELETEHVREITGAMARLGGDDKEWGEILSGFHYGLSAWGAYFEGLTAYLENPENAVVSA